MIGSPRGSGPSCSSGSSLVDDDPIEHEIKPSPPGSKKIVDVDFLKGQKHGGLFVSFRFEDQTSVLIGGDDFYDIINTLLRNANAVHALLIQFPNDSIGCNVKLHLKQLKKLYNKAKDCGYSKTMIALKNEIDNFDYRKRMMPASGFEYLDPKRPRLQETRLTHIACPPTTSLLIAYPGTIAQPFSSEERFCIRFSTNPPTKRIIAQFYFGSAPNDHIHIYGNNFYEILERVLSSPKMTYDLLKTYPNFITGDDPAVHIEKLQDVLSKAQQSPYIKDETLEILFNEISHLKAPKRTRPTR